MIKTVTAVDLAGTVGVMTKWRGDTYTESNTCLTIFIGREVHEGGGVTPTQEIGLSSDQLLMLRDFLNRELPVEPKL